MPKSITAGPAAASRMRPPSPTAQLRLSAALPAPAAPPAAAAQQRTPHAHAAAAASATGRQSRLALQRLALMPPATPALHARPSMEVRYHLLHARMELQAISGSPANQTGKGLCDMIRETHLR